MRTRSSIFTTLLLIASLIASIPIVGGGGDIVWATYRYGHFPFDFLGLDNKWSYSCNSYYETIVGNAFYDHHWFSITDPGRAKMCIDSIDPETGGRETDVVVDSQSKDFEFAAPFPCPRYAGNGNQTWMIDKLGHVYEREGKCWHKKSVKASDQPLVPFDGNPGNRRDTFVLDDKLTTFKQNENGQIEWYEFVSGSWESIGFLELLDPACDWQLANQQCQFKGIQDSTENPTRSLGLGRLSLGKFEILPIGSIGHLFVVLNDQLLYRRGVSSELMTTQTRDWRQSVSNENPLASALRPANVVGIADDWFLVAADLSAMNLDVWHLIAVAGELAVLLIDQSKSGNVEMRTLRFIDEVWTECASFKMPIPSFNPNVGSNANGSISYVRADRLWGRKRMFAIEMNGFRKTQFKDSPWQGVSGFFLIVESLFWNLLAASALGTLAQFLMRKDCRQFDFQHRTVTLATLWQRGCARVIDLMLFIAILAGVFYGLTRAWDIDWFSAAEARVVGVKQHPSFASAYRTLLACQIMGGVMLLLLIVFQGRNGLTPGKWFCGLRTMRTTLRPCGFARSLVREFLLCVDSVNLFSWIPGILSIAFTEHRQRLGDVVADTIVVSDKRSASGPHRVIPSFSPHS